MNRLTTCRQVEAWHWLRFHDRRRRSPQSRYPRQPCWSKERIAALPPEESPDNRDQIFSEQCLQYLRRLSTVGGQIRGKTRIILSEDCGIAVLRFNQGRSGN